MIAAAIGAKTAKATAVRIKMGPTTFKSDIRPTNHAPSPSRIKLNCRPNGGFFLILILILISFLSLSLNLSSEEIKIKIRIRIKSMSTIGHQQIVTLGRC